MKNELSAKCKDKLYVISLKDSYLKKKYKVRAFYLNPGLNFYIYGIPKMPNGWVYDFPDEHGFDKLIGTADTDKEAVDIGYFKDFFTFILLKDDHQKSKPGLRMTFFCNKPDGTAKLIELGTKDFNIKIINKCPKWY
ncbi:MAG: hypothetical protein H7843_04805 [Nitrospirota bacterium]